MLKKYIPPFQQNERAAEPFPWLLAYFRQIYDRVSPERAYASESLHYAYSWDGAHWTAINHNRPVYFPVLDGCTVNIRDPFIGRGPDGSFHLLCTEGTQDSYGGSLVYAHSDDLIHWGKVHRIPIMEAIPGARVAWAPEFVYDPLCNDFFVFWSSTLAEEVREGKHIWCSRTPDFQVFSSPRPLFDPGLNVIDAHIVCADHRCLLFFKPDMTDETKYVGVAVADQLEGPYEMMAEGITPAVSEGPQVMRRSQPDAWYLYYDLAYENRYGLSISTDLAHWEPVGKVSFPEDARHGSFLSISEDELAMILWRYDFRFMVESAQQPEASLG